MKIVYLSNTQIPSRSTNALQIMRMCSAFAEAGADVTLVHPNRLGNRPEGLDGDIWSFYGVPNRFRIVTLPTPLTLRLSRYRRLARALHALPLALYILAISAPGRPWCVVYGRSLLGASLALWARRLWGNRSAVRAVALELHDEPPTRAAWKTVGRSGLVVSISRALRDRLVDVQPVLAERTIVEHDGVDLESFAAERMDRAGSRRRLLIEDGQVVVAYTGRVNGEKGAATLVRCAEAMRDSDVRFLLVGKVYDDRIRAAAESAGNVTLTGFVPPSRIPEYVAAADILVMPTSASISYARYTSPLKLFEYMASGRPVVCSDLPVLCEVVQDGRNALTFETDNSAALAEALLTLARDAPLRESLARRAREDASRFDWVERADRILGQLTVLCAGPPEL
jgi:glycosyltransferase involved in cell wall biosynthesis